MGRIRLDGAMTFTSKYELLFYNALFSDPVQDDDGYARGYRMEKVSGVFSSSGGIPLMVQEHFSEIRRL